MKKKGYIQKTSINSNLREMLGSLLVSIWVFDKKGKIIGVNAAAEHSGFQVKDMIGKDLKYLEKADLFDILLAPTVLKNKKQITKIQYTRHSKKYMVSTATPMFDENGDILFVIVNGYDISQLQRLQEKLDLTLNQVKKLKDEIAELSMIETTEKEIVASSEKMKQALKLAFKISRFGATEILILGDSGTGKGLLSKFIHKSCKLKGEPFIQINCAALPETLLEAELFGYEKGAFTGAKNHGKVGLFELAQGGTLFLDEIGDLPFSIQAKLLKWLDDHEIMPLGSVKSKHITCTVIAATNHDLESLVKRNLFRKDLLYRLNTFTIRIPPLRDRPEDILGLVDFFLVKYNKMYKMKKRITEESYNLLQTYNYPGNVRELENIIKNAMVMSENDSLDSFIKKTLDSHVMKTSSLDDIPYQHINLPNEILKTEKSILKKALVNFKSTREMAHYLGVSQPTIVRKMKKHNLSQGVN